jgi:protease-4
VGGPQLFVFQEALVPRTGGAPTAVFPGTALFLGTPLLPGLSAGVGLEWLHPREGQGGSRRTTWAAALGNRTASLGASYGRLSAADPALEGRDSFDLGLTVRPADVLSLAVAGRGLNTSRADGAGGGPVFQSAVAARPFGENTTLAADWTQDLGGLQNALLGYTLQQRLARGLVAGATLSHGVRAGVPLEVRASLTWDLDHLGLTGLYSPQAAGVGLRLSSQRYRSADLSPGGAAGGKVALLDLGARLAGGGGTVLELLGLSGGEDPYLRLTRWLDAAARDPELAGVVLKLEGLPDVGLAKALELRAAVARLKGAGKKVVAVLLRADDVGYLVASAADQVLAVPEATLLVNGLSASVTSLGGAVEAVGVRVDVARVGEYKTAPEQFVRKEPSAAQRETVNALLDDQSRALEAALAQSRALPVEKVREALAKGILHARQAQALGLLDGLVTNEDLEERLAALVPGARFAEDYSPFGERPVRWTPAPRIAVVPVLGSITGGRSGADPLGLQAVAGAESVVAALERAAADPRVKAIVLRVDSPGGDGLASDLMFRAVREARKKKPVVASMGDVAASGGYYAAMGADEVLALPTTVTGSIGVFMVKPALKGLGEKLKVQRETFRRAPLAGLLDTWEPWDPAAQAAAQAWVDAFYDDFITLVAESRKLDKAKVDAVARGRVWSGEDALAHGLVDGLGGLADAVAAARRRAGLAEGEAAELVVVDTGSGGVLSGAGDALAEAGLLPHPAGTAAAPRVPGVEALVPAPLRALAAEVGLPAAHLLEPGAKALLPFRLEVH